MDTGVVWAMSASSVHQWTPWSGMQFYLMPTCGFAPLQFPWHRWNVRKSSALQHWMSKGVSPCDFLDKLWTRSAMFFCARTSAEDGVNVSGLAQCRRPAKLSFQSVCLVYPHLVFLHQLMEPAVTDNSCSRKGGFWGHHGGVCPRGLGPGSSQTDQRALEQSCWQQFTAERQEADVPSFGVAGLPDDMELVVPVWPPGTKGAPPLLTHKCLLHVKDHRPPKTGAGTQLCFRTFPYKKKLLAMVCGFQFIFDGGAHCFSVPHNACIGMPLRYGLYTCVGPAQFSDSWHFPAVPPSPLTCLSSIKA